LSKVGRDVSLVSYPGCLRVSVCVPRMAVPTHPTHGKRAQQAIRKFTRPRAEPGRSCRWARLVENRGNYARQRISSVGSNRENPVRVPNHHYCAAMRLALIREVHILRAYLENASEQQTEWLKAQLLGNRRAFERLRVREEKEKDSRNQNHASG